jgi:hypothetical protein
LWALGKEEEKYLNDFNSPTREQIIFLHCVSLIKTTGEILSKNM